jgi:hypothetical protein
MELMIEEAIVERCGLTIRCTRHSCRADRSLSDEPLNRKPDGGFTMWRTTMDQSINAATEDTANPKHEPKSRCRAFGRETVA